MWLAEAGLYHYKARIYDPGLGRFLQTDPIGYADGLNLYAYVGGDPVNARDPSGLEGIPCFTCIYADGSTGSSRRRGPGGGGFSGGGGEFSGRGGNRGGGGGFRQLGGYCEGAFGPCSVFASRGGGQRPDPFAGFGGNFAGGNNGEGGGGRGRNTPDRQDDCNIAQKFAGALALGFELSSNAVNAISDIAYLGGLRLGAPPALGTGAGLDALSIGLDAISYAFDLAAGNNVRGRLGASLLKLVPGSTVGRAALRIAESEGRAAEAVLSIIEPETQRKCGI